MSDASGFGHVAGVETRIVLPALTTKDPRSRFSQPPMAAPIVSGTCFPKMRTPVLVPHLVMNRGLKILFACQRASIGIAAASLFPSRERFDR